MPRVLKQAALILAVALAGCRGAIFTNVTTPLVLDLNNTPVFERGAVKGGTKRVRYYVEVEWDSNAIGDIAKRAGLSEIHYADMQVFSILGFWKQEYVIVYGK